MFNYLVFGSASLAILLGSIGSTAIAVALRDISTSFDASIIMAGWVLGGYQLVTTVFNPLVGKASDSFGTKRVFLFCLGMFIVGSVLSAVAPSIELLIGARLLAGVGGGGIMPSASSIVADAFPRSRQRAIGLLTSIMPIGQVLGPVLGGWITHHFGWQAVFWFNLPLGLVVLAVAALVLRPVPGSKARVDTRGATLFGGMLAAFMIGLTTLGNGGGQQALSAVFFVASVVLGVLFWRHEMAVANPIIETEVLRGRPFVAANIFNFLFGMSNIALVSFIPLYAISVYGMTTLQSGVVMAPRSLGVILTAVVASFFLVRWGYRRPMLAGVLTSIAALLLLAVGPLGIPILGALDATTLLVVTLLVSGLGMGLAMPAANNACMELMPERVGTITGLRVMFRGTGGVLAITAASVVLDGTASAEQGFLLVFLGLALAAILSIPAIFAMPGSPVPARPPATRLASDHAH